MATIKVKFRPSKVKGKAGTICYQLCHRQENRQITTGMRIFPHWWNEKEREPIVVTGNENTVSAYKRQIERDLEMTSKLKNSYYIYEVDVNTSRGKEIELEIDGRNGKVIYVEVDRY